MKIMLLVIILLTLTACASLEGTNKQNIVYTSSWKNKWQDAILERCRKESVTLTLSIYESRLSVGQPLTGQDVDGIEKMLVDGCIRYYHLDI